MKTCKHYKKTCSAGRQKGRADWAPLALSLILLVCLCTCICVCAHFPAVLSFCHKKLRMYYSGWPHSIDAHERLRQSMWERGRRGNIEGREVENSEWKKLHEGWKAKNRKTQQKSTRIEMDRNITELHLKLITYNLTCGQRNRGKVNASTL